MKFNATPRSVQGSSASRRLRRAGRVPAIVYGGKAQPLNVELDHNEIYHALRKEEFHASILTMELEGGKSETVLLRAAQWHPYKQQVLHVDFQRVDSKQTLTTKVPLHFLNAEVSPAVKLGGALISHVQTELEISCLPADLPQNIEIDLAGIEVGGMVHAADLKLPKGVELAAHVAETNPVLVIAQGKKGGAAAEAADGEEAAAE
ncbi:50S ribosomal protein L25/general stress protein Ctc [Paracandidimonas soli]|uniref:50S ribosomal protein L25/general stress protein Ctc n=1 Tax=Paracandidimonas soli TaxID=1917182 RepID=UPI00334148E1